MNLSIDWQGIDRDGIVSCFDFIPIGVSYRRLARAHFIDIWLIFWVIGVYWSGD